MQTKNGKASAELAFLFNLKTKGMIILNFYYNGEVVQGDPVEVVQGMKLQVYDHERFQSLDEYMQWLVGSVWRFHGKGITIQGESLAARCESLVQQLAGIGLLEPVKE